MDFIQKPIEPDILRSKVEVFFELYRQRQQLAAQRDGLATQAAALQEAAIHKDILLREINHRIKNLFSLTTGLISLGARPATSVAELELDLKSRMGGLARAHELTLPDLNESCGSASSATTISALLKAIVAPHEHAQGPHVSINGSDAPLKGTALTSLALLLHELTTNAADLTVFGALTNADELFLAIGQYDVIVTLEGPRNYATVRKKERVLGIWMNTESMTFEQVPESYSLASTREIDAIDEAPSLNSIGVGINHLALMSLGT